MKFKSDTIVVDTPAPGHYAIRGHAPRSANSPSGKVVPLDVCYITPEVPSEVLAGILEERGFFNQAPVAFDAGGLDSARASLDEADVPDRDEVRLTKAQIDALEIREVPSTIETDSPRPRDLPDAQGHDHGHKKHGKGGK